MENNTEIVNLTINNPKLKPLLSKEEIKKILKELQDLKNYKKLDYAEMDFASLGKIILEGPPSKVITHRSALQEQKILEKNKEGEYEYLIDGINKFVPEKYSPFVEYTIRVKSKYGKENKKSAFLHKIGKYLDSSVKWFSGKDDNLYTQFETVLYSINDFKIEMKKDINHLKETNDNNSFDSVYHLPDVFDLICRLFLNENLNKNNKLDLVYALIYIVSPVDFIPEEYIDHPISYADDLGVSLYVLNNIIKENEIIKEDFSQIWTGEFDFYNNIDNWYAEIKNLLGDSFIPLIIEYFGKISDNKIN